MSRTDLEALGAFVTEQPIRREVQWVREDGETVSFNCWVRQIPFGEAEKLLQIDDQDQERSAYAVLISRTICLDETGKVRMDYKDAYRLKPSFAQALMDAINQVYNLAKKSRPPMSSGTSSSSPASAGEPSQKPSAD